jgi:two-component system, NarL family, sensor histidine kinase DesK
VPATEVNRPDRHVVQRHAAVLVWVPVILGGLLLDLPAGAPAMAAVLVLVVAGAVACVVAVIASWPRATPRSSLAVAILAAAVAAGSLAWSSWTPAWLLVAMSAAVALPTRASLVAVPASALASAWTLSRWGATRDELLAQAFVVLLAGAAAAAFSRLVSTADELRRTREELAEHAVARERERFSRDLHDTLGHTLSVVVVKAAVVRRLVPTDPAAAAQHAADIEQVARQAMAQLRDTVDGAVVPRLDDELRQAQAALAAAGIRATVRTDQAAPAVAAAPLAWAVREGVTNVLRHSEASECRVEVTHAVGRVRLTITDDGLGAPAALDAATDAGRAGRRGGLDGLRARLSAAGGGLDVAPRDGGFSLTAWVPDGTGPQ